jgi:predicted amino acid racemase
MNSTGTAVRYPLLRIDLQKLKTNLETLSAMAKSAGSSLMIVTKSFCADEKIVKMLAASPLVDYLADSRIQNIKTCAGLGKPTVLLRLPQACEVQDTVSFADISLNSDIDTLNLLNREAERQNKKHKIILMIDLGDLREGIYFEEGGKILKTAEAVLQAPGLELYGIGTNLTCYGAVIPKKDNLSVLASWAERIYLRFGVRPAVVSGGNSSSLYLIEKGGLPSGLPPGINNLRLGESFILGRETAYGARIKNTFNDAVILETQIIEVQVKPSMPSGESGFDAFGKRPVFEDRGMMKRGICAAGKQDTDPAGIIPLDPGIEILGASSDHLIVNLTAAERDYKTGDILRFIPDYGALLRLFTSPYVSRAYTG